MIVDVFAGVALLAGAALAALGGFGLVRFPDVFTRMHAATKVATVGVIGATAAAAAEAGAVSGVLVLMLVIALLFLSGPLGMSLLARAAYHDPETPRVSTATQPDIAAPPPESTRASRTSGTSRLLALWLLVVWVVLFGSLRPNVVAGGVIVAAGVAFALRTLAPRWPEALLHPVRALRFTSHFAVQLLISTWDVIRLLWRDTSTLHPAVLEIPLTVRTRNEVALLMNAISFTPGTVALEVHHDHLFLHVLSPKPPSRVIEDINTMQRLIAEAFGTAAVT